jgi:hypothetical protein
MLRILTLMVVKAFGDISRGIVPPKVVSEEDGFRGIWPDIYGF